MNKPTIFFSHSSKDKDIILSIKRRIDSITGGTLDIFMSSDGQSIPFGRNWIYKVEEGLNAAQIMFVFVTPNSILSNWIYFEAGFAYAKSIEVIPVGVGIDIGLLKAPLNLLQGFNIVSSDSLNNFIKIINKKFNYCFKDEFIDSDFADIVDMTDGNTRTFDISNIFSYADCEIFSRDKDTNGENAIFNLHDFIKQVIDYLKSESIAYSYEGTRFSSTKSILAAGIKISYQAGRPDEIKIKISPYNFQATFPLLSHIVGSLGDRWAYLRFHLNSNYMYITSQETTSAIIANMRDNFEFSSSRIGSYRFTKGNLSFSIYNMNASQLIPSEYVLDISYHPQNTTAEDIVECVRLLMDGEIIHQKEDHHGE